MEPIARIDAALRRAVETNEVPGVVAMAATDKGIIYEGTFGTRDLARGPDMTLDTMFRLASMTKPVTSVAAMALPIRLPPRLLGALLAGGTRPLRSPL